MSSIVRINGVSKQFGAVKAVDSVSLDVRENEFLALLGASGCGKTTLLRMIAGLEQVDAGAILIGDEDMTHVPPYARPVNMMFQSYALFPHMSVEDNVAFGLKQDGLRGAELSVRVREALAAVEMEALAGRKPQQLSGGQRQRVALARCLAKRPRVLLLDEPLAALDKHLRERTQLELMALRARLGITFIVVTHDQGEAMAMADRIAVMDAGRILQVAPPREIYERPASQAVARFFGDINMWPITEERIADLGIAAPTASEGSVAVLRPERISMNKDAGGAISGVVQEMVYLGSGTTYFVKANAGGVVRVLVAGENGAFARGDAVQLSWPEAALTVLPS